MSYNRLRYDQCAYKTEINQSVGPLEYLLNPMKYENCQKCRHEFGLVGGTNVSQISGNLVDLENDLRGQTRQNTKCPDLKYAPTEGNVIQVAGNACNSARQIDLTPVHLPPCQMLRFPPTVLPGPQEYNNCPTPQVQLQKPCGN
jgi:hypothetical protein